MSIFNRIKNIFSQDENEKRFENIISETVKEGERKNFYFYDLKLTDFEVFKNTVQPFSDAEKIDFILYCSKKIKDDEKAMNIGFNYENIHYKTNNVRKKYINHLLKTKLEFQEEQINNFNDFFRKNNKWEWNTIQDYSVHILVGNLEKNYSAQNLPESVKQLLQTLKENCQNSKSTYETKQRQKLIDKIESLLFSSENSSEFKPFVFVGQDELSDFANAKLSNLKSEEQKFWFQILPLAQKATGSKPSKKFLDESLKIIKELGAEKFKNYSQELFQFVIDLKEKMVETEHVFHKQTYLVRHYDFLSDINSDILKGLVWMSSHFHDAKTLQTLSQLAERCYKKIPEKGPAAAGIGNACLFALYSSKGLDGIGMLSRLRLKVKQTNTQNLIQKYLQEAADKNGVSTHEIEDLAVDDYKLISGERIFEFDDYKAKIKIISAGKSILQWLKPDGNEQKSVPAFVKEKHSEKLKKVKNIQKQIDLTTIAQRDRIDRMFRIDRRISQENFQKNYLQHGLMSFLAKKIIWNFWKNEERISAFFSDNQWKTINGEILEPENFDEFSLWHPAISHVSEVKNWRNFLIDNQIQQPLKQAFREIYILTEAELNTKTYSNRMAAHILKQHQYVTLAKSRNWSAKLIGSWDGDDDDTSILNIPEYNISAEYWVNALDQDDAFNDVGIWNFVTTDQVRFVNNETREIIDLINVPKVLFSEVMRDVDLFVGVASVGNDPTWSDSGNMPNQREYWVSYSFGDLSEIAKNRKETLERLLPRLKIAKISEIKDKFLVVKGKLRTYKIHIGSTNILMEPNDEYLCIVPDRSKNVSTENLFIPFEGDNGLSIVLSKAFLLAEDDKITDPTIVSQIKK